jgi:hypothetical protein
VTRAEIEAFAQSFGARLSNDEETEPGAAKPKGLIDHISDHMVAESFILDWKTSKALYEEYGSGVIFQQFNPLEPVGAYLALLREQEAMGSFQIFDDALSAGFWDYFTRDHGHWFVKPEKVDYSKPWWERE